MAKKQLRKDLETRIMTAISDMAQSTEKKVGKAVKKASRWLADALHQQPVKKKAAPEKKTAAPKKKTAPVKKTAPKKKAKVVK